MRFTVNRNTAFPCKIINEVPTSTVPAAVSNDVEI